jgi:RNA recognition motif-containing protein
MRIYVGNLSYEVTSDDLQQEFTAFGKVESVTLVTDRDTGRSKGFAFVEMPTVSEAQNAIGKLNGKVLKERALTVSAARPRSDDRSGGGRQGGGRSGGYGDRPRRY